MFADHQNAVAQREALVGIVCNCGVERGVPDRDARRCGHDPADLLVVAIPHLDAEWQARGYGALAPAVSAGWAPRISPRNDGIIAQK